MLKIAPIGGNDLWHLLVNQQKKMALKFQKKFVIKFVLEFTEQEDSRTKKFEIKFPMKNFVEATPMLVSLECQVSCSYSLEISIIMFRSLKKFSSMKRKEKSKNQLERIDDRLIIVYLILFFCKKYLSLNDDQIDPNKT